MYIKRKLSHINIVGLITMLSTPLVQADILQSSTMSLIDTQLNSTYWAAQNLLDNNASTLWLSSKQTNDINFQLGSSEVPACFSSFELTNYGNNDRAVKQFMLLTATDGSLKTDSGTAGWKPVVADANPSGKIDYLSWAQGARLVSAESQLNSSSWAAKHLNDGSSTSRWLSSKSNNVIEYNFDTDWDGITGDGIPINEIEVVNYGTDDRSVKEFQVEVTTDGSIWTKLEVPATAADDLEFVYTLKHNGGVLENIDSQLNSTSWAAANMHDGDYNTRWLSSKNNNTIEFTFDPNNNGITGANGDISDVFTVDKFSLVNYGSDDRSVSQFQVSVKTLSNPAWQKIRVPGAIIGQTGYNFALSHHGGTLVTIDNQLNATSWGADNIHDGDFKTRWLSGKGNNTLAFQFDPNENGIKGEAADLFTLDSFYLRNYGNDDRAIKNFQVEVKTSSNTNWIKLKVPGTAVGEADFNFTLSHHGAVLVAIDNELNSSSWGARNIHDGDLNTRWLSNKGNNTLEFQFDLNADGTLAGAADLFTPESFFLVNYGNNDRAVKQFQVEVKTITNSNWVKLPVAGTATNTPGYNFVLSAHGGSLTTIDSELNSTSWGADNIHDGDQNTRWLSAKQTNTLAFNFDTNNDGVRGDSVNLDTLELINYGGDDRSIQTFEIDIQISGGAWQSVSAPEGGTVFTANMDNTRQSWLIGPYSNVTAVQMRTLTNYGDPSYTGASEIVFSGASVAPSYTFTAAMHGNGETFTLDPSQPVVDVTDVRIRTINNYGDPSYIGLSEFKLLGPSVSQSETFTAAMHADGETFTLDDPLLNVTDVKLVTISNYGDPSYTGAAEFKLFGPSVTKSKTFTASMHGNGETFILDDNDVPIDVTTVKLTTINNYGDPSYIGLREFEVVGASVTPGYTFTLPMTATPHTIVLDNEDSVSGVIGARIVTIKNHGDPSYTGLSEFRLRGNAITPSYIFDAQMDTSVQVFEFLDTSANVFRFHSLSNQGDPSYMGAADFALNSGTCVAAEWRMDEGSWTGASNEVIDSSGNNHHGVAFGFGVGDDPSTLKINPPLSGDPGSCRYGEFDGVDDYIIVASGDELDNVSQLTLAAWFKADSFIQINGTDSRGVFSKGPMVGSERSYGAFFTNDSASRLNVDIDGSNDRFLSNTIFNTDTWYHIAIVFDGTKSAAERVKLYVDGVLDGTFSESSAVIPNTNADLYIGNSFSTSNELKVFDGSIDEVNIKPNALQASEIAVLMNSTRTCTLPLHHIEISHDGSALTCSDEPLTVKACTNSDCSTVYHQDINITLSTTGVSSLWSQNPITIPEESMTGITVNLSHTTAETVTLDVTSVPAASNPVVCSPNCDLIFSDSGYLLTLADHQSCTVPELTIKAVKLSDTGTSCAPAYTGDQSINFIFDYANPTTGSKLPDLDGSGMAAATVIQNRTINFDTTGTANLSFTYQDAGRISVNVSDAADKGLTSSSVTTVVSPAKLIVTNSDGSSDCASNDASCSAFKAAGEAFNLSVSAACSDNTVTPNFEMHNIPLILSTVAPDMGNPVYLGINSINVVDSDNGVHIEESQTVSEVGVFTITAKPPSNGYFGVTIPSATSDSIGRFTPANFDLDTTYEGALNGGNPFVYVGQMSSTSSSDGKISYDIEPEFTITAKSLLGNTTLNYTGDFLKMQAANIIRLTPVTDTVQLGADITNKVNVTANLNPALFSGNSGVLTYRYNSSDSFFYNRELNSIIAPYTADIDLKIVSITDDDGIDANDADGDNTNGTVLTLNPFGLEVRFGRWYIENTYGPETHDLAMPMQIQYWDGNKFATNNADNFTVFNASSKGTITDISLAPAITSVFGNGSFITGKTNNLILSSPGANNHGEISFSYTAPTWLQFDWKNEDGGFNGPYDDNPSANATFGLYRGNDRIISWREVLY